MTEIEITAEAFAAIAGSLPAEARLLQPLRSPKGGFFVHLDHFTLATRSCGWRDWRRDYE